MKKTLLCLFIALIVCVSSHAEVIRQSGPGYLELVDGQRILHLEGTPYEIGYQHGVLLKEQINGNIARFVNQLSSENAPPVARNFIAALPTIMPYIPASFLQEMEGMAAGSGIPYSKILLLNLFPEMFHCSGITVTDKATQDGKLYHVRVLDYSAAITLQNTAVVAIVKPVNGHAFLNITYAGFLGVVTGMNDQKISMGEIGGKGYGSWNGVPMAFLLRQLLEKTSSLEEIKQHLSITPRTCEYYYIFSDGKTKESLGVYATADKLNFINPGSTYNFLSNSKNESNPEHKQPQDCIILTRWDHYDLLKERLMKNYGQIGLSELQEAIKRPVAHAFNLHNAIFAPETLEVWISHAGPHNEPACDQSYHHFNLEELLNVTIGNAIH